MDKTRPCGCKGCRSCLICEAQYDIKPKCFDSLNDKSKCYFHCIPCKKAYRGWNSCILNHPHHKDTGFDLPGVFILENFINEEEEEHLVRNIEESLWDISQSGRRKKNYGPKTNFKKRKIVNGSFCGFPSYAKFLQDRFEQIDILKNYETVELCFMEYDPKRGASIDPHIDDCWIWGERIVTVNCLSDSVLTLNRFTGDISKYNLVDAKNYNSIVTSDGKVDFGTSQNKQSAFEVSLPLNNDDITVRLPMPRRSLMVLYGEARYHWEHCVLREDITERRVCVAYRELTLPYLPGGPKCNIVEEVRDNAKTFW